MFDEWINKKNLAAADEMVTLNYVSHEGGEDTNAENGKKFLAGVFTSFPDIHISRATLPQPNVTSALAPKNKRADDCQGESDVGEIVSKPAEPQRLKIFAPK